MRRSITVVAVLCALMISACAEGPIRVPPGAEATTTAPGGAPSEEGRRSAGTATTKGAPAAPPPPPAAPPPDESRAESYDGAKGPPGAFARTVLRPQPAKTIVLERAVQEGADVSSATLNRNAGVLGKVSGKTVDVRPPTVLAGGAKNWTADQLRAAADATSKTPQGDGRAVLRLVLVRGNFQGNDEVLGVAVRGDVLALFPDSIAAAGTPLISSRSIEDAVLLHEFGHLLGLVDIARDTGRADPEHPGHSKSRESVMYWAVESSLITQVVQGGPPRDFDGADLDDLRALRNGA